MRDEELTEESPPASPSDGPAEVPPGPPHSPSQALILFAVSLALFWGTTFLREVEVSIVQELAPALGVLAWIVPAYVMASRRGHDPFRVHAVLTKPRGLVSAAGVSLLILVLYVAVLSGFAHAGGKAPGAVPWADVGQRFLHDLILVALAEEYFFRGVLQPALERPDGPRLRLLGAPVGRGVVLAALLFAVAHLLLQPSLYRAAVFFPALWFGWVRAKTGSVLPAVVAHALANAVELGCLRALGFA